MAEPLGTTVNSDSLLGMSEDVEVPSAATALVNLTRLQPVAITSVWPTEPHHFTPWLLANAGLLSGTLGLDVELESREYKVGKFSLDIIGHEVATGTPVIVENQYGPTDHGHLGQILTYAGGTKPPPSCGSPSTSGRSTAPHWSGSTPTPIPASASSSLSAARRGGRRCVDPSR